MDAKGKKRIVIWVSVAALLGVGGYFAYKFVKAKRDKKKAEQDAASTSSTSTSSSNSASSESVVPPSPLYPDDLLKFQKYVLTRDKNILGSTGADGKWGRNSWNAYQKYYKDWKASLGGSTTTIATTPTSTGFGEVGKFAYTLGYAGLGYANVWSKPDASTSWFYGSAFIGQVNAPNIIGKIINASIGDKDGKLWYQVNLLTPLSNSTAITNLGTAVPNQTKGWVRADQIKVKAL
jgi:hypothetical protein